MNKNQNGFNQGPADEFEDDPPGPAAKQPTMKPGGSGDTAAPAGEKPAAPADAASATSAAAAAEESTAAAPAGDGTAPADAPAPTEAPAAGGETNPKYINYVTAAVELK